MRPALFLLTLALPVLAVQGPAGLPPWAVAAAQSGREAKAPEGADAWVLLQKTEYAYAGGGEVLKHQFRLVRILTEHGTEEATFALAGLGGTASKVKELHGWNLRPDGAIVTLDTREVFTLGEGIWKDAGFSTRVVTTARLARVTPGSIIAFESLERLHLPQGPADLVPVMEEHPVRHWELSLGTASSWFRSVKTVPHKLETRHFQPWLAQARITGDTVAIDDLPAEPREEALHPHAINTLPMVYLAFVDPRETEGPGLGSWDDYAQWMYGVCAPKFKAVAPVPLEGLGPVAGLGRTLAWMDRELQYKQVYLTPERGWIPEASDEVLRRRYGDCKDLTSCLCGAARTLGLEACPVLARIVEGVVEPDLPVTPCAFNHLITAVRLKATLGLPAEVDTPRGRFLLVDPTSQLTPLGLLPPVHRGGRVLICTGDGAQWVDIPDRAVEDEALEVTVAGTLSAEGTLDADVTFSERGDMAALRGEALTGNARDLKEQVLSLLGLGAGAEVRVGAPEGGRELDLPMVVKAAVKAPHALMRAGGEFALGPMGFPHLPPVVQRPGRPRQYPVEVRTRSAWVLHLELELPFPMAPVAPEGRLDTPFRLATWTARMKGNHFSGTFTQARREARFASGEREAGVTQARKDRAGLKGLIEDATSFKTLP